MALRDQPYLPLYIQDFLTDEKLNECSASATGVYIKIMCLMHKNDPYGKVLLKQSDKQNDKQIINFASKFARLLPYTVETIIAALDELLREKVVYLEGDYLCQKRMISDNDLSIKRSNSGSKGGKKTQENVKNFALAKTEANTEYENDNVFIDNKDMQGMNTLLASFDHTTVKKSFLPVYEKMMNAFLLKFSGYFRDESKDYLACEVIASNVEKIKGWEQGDCLNGHMGDLLTFWSEVVDYVAADKWLRTRALSDLSTKEWQRLGQHMANVENPDHSKKKKKEETMTDYEKEIAEKRAAAKNNKG